MSAVMVDSIPVFQDDNDMWGGSLLPSGQVFASMLGHFNALPWAQPVEVEEGVSWKMGLGYQWTMIRIGILSIVA